MEGHPGQADEVRRVVGEIVSLVEARRYLPGERLPSERDLAERYAVGRATVREAVTRLESMRYIERRRGSGIFRAHAPEAASIETLALFAELGLPLDAKTNAEAIEVRRVIEVQAVGLACERRTAEDLARLDETLARYADSDSFTREAPGYDYDFHLGMFRAAHNDVLLMLVTPFYIMSKTRRAAFFNDRDRCRVSHRQHEAMVEAIRARHKADAMKLMAAHIGRVEDHFR